MTAPVDNYTVASGQPIYGGMTAPSTTPGFDTVAFTAGPGGGAPGVNDYKKPLAISLHGSGGINLTTGYQYRAGVSGFMAFPGTTSPVGTLGYDAHNTYGFSECLSYPTPPFPDHMMLRPIDRWTNDTGVVKESYHMGFIRSDGKFHLISERRYDAMLDWGIKTLTKYNWNTLCLYGGSMGGWGSASFGLRRAKWFAAIYPDRPRWNCTTVALPIWDGTSASAPYTKANSPLLAPEDGGGSAFDYYDSVSFILNPANKLPWVGWCAGRQDGYAGDFNDQIAVMDAMIAAKRGFAFYWNNGGHEAGSSVDKIWSSYPVGTFDKTKGYPLFTNCSRDQDPRVHIAGGKNIDLKFRNVVETPTSWSCEITCVTPTTITGTLFGSLSTTQVQLPITASEVPDVYVGGTLAINGETRTISAYSPVSIDPTDGARDRKLPATVTVSTPFSTQPASNAAYTLVRQDQACTVKVEPISDVFKAQVAKQTVTIPAANTWVPVTFTA